MVSKLDQNGQALLPHAGDRGGLKRGQQYREEQLRTRQFQPD
jgi:hypothetical protein